MWPLIKAELKYNSDIINAFLLFYSVMLVFLYLLGSGYLGYERMDADWIAYFIEAFSIFLPLNIRLRWQREKKDRLHAVLPISLRSISKARLYTFGLILVLIFFGALLLYQLFYSLYPETSTSMLSILVMIGFGFTFNAIFFFLIPDFKGFVSVDNRVLGIPPAILYRFLRVIFIILGCLMGIMAFLAAQIGDRIKPDMDFGSLLVRIYCWIFQSISWSALFLAGGLILFTFTIVVFEKRKTYI